MRDHKEEEPTFASFKGLGYVSMVKGVPLWPLLIFFALGLFGTFFLWLLIGLVALLWAFFCAGALMALKIMCETDNKAMERVEWMLKGQLLRFKKSSMVLTVSPNKTGSKYERFCKQLKKIYRSS